MPFRALAGAPRPGAAPVAVADAAGLPPFIATFVLGFMAAFVVFSELIIVLDGVPFRCWYALICTGLPIPRLNCEIKCRTTHCWSRQTVRRFVEMVDLNSNVIRLGPMTLCICLRARYAASGADIHRKIQYKKPQFQYNLYQELGGTDEAYRDTGGTAHLLMHRNWKFQKFVSKKINSDDLKHFKVRQTF
eukprot:1905513-Rhodomonas_salina.1